MNKWVGVAVFGVVLGFAANADALDDWVKARSSVKVADLTVGDWKDLAGIRSVERQEARYVRGAAMASFLVPGWGQFKTGDPWAGTANLVGHAALVGASLYGAWALLPDDVRTSGLSSDQGHDRMKDYWTKDFGKIAPSVGVLVGGSLLSLAHRVWAADDAKARAQDNLKSGTVTFEPTFDGHVGFLARVPF